MRFTPKSEEELQIMNLIPPGTYPFEVIESDDKPSKTGNDMITLTLKVWDSQGNERILRDWLLEAMAYKLKHFADVTGLADKYQSGHISHTDCLSKTGHLKLIIQDDKNGQYGPRNTVKDYIKVMESSTNAVPAKKSNSSEPFFDDEIIPF